MPANTARERRGSLVCRDLGDRTEISGRAKTYMRGEIMVQGDAFP